MEKLYSDRGTYWMCAIIYQGFIEGGTHGSNVDLTTRIADPPNYEGLGHAPILESYVLYSLLRNPLLVSNSGHTLTSNKKQLQGKYRINYTRILSLWTLFYNSPETFLQL